MRYICACVICVFRSVSRWRRMSFNFFFHDLSLIDVGAILTSQPTDHRQRNVCSAPRRCSRVSAKRANVCVWERERGTCATHIMRHWIYTSFGLINGTMRFIHWLIHACAEHTTQPGVYSWISWSSFVPMKLHVLIAEKKSKVECSTNAMLLLI